MTGSCVEFQRACAQPQRKLSSMTERIDSHATPCGTRLQGWHVTSNEVTPSKTCRDGTLMHAIAGDKEDLSVRSLVLALLALAFGHMLSTLLRTIPAISLDLMAADFHLEPQALASLTSIYPFALRRWRRFPWARRWTVLACVRSRSACSPAPWSARLSRDLATGPASFALGQLLLGISTSGMLMCPMTLAVKKPCLRRDSACGRARSCRSAISACCCRRALSRS